MIQGQENDAMTGKWYSNRKMVQWQKKIQGLESDTGTGKWYRDRKVIQGQENGKKSEQPKCQGQVCTLIEKNMFSLKFNVFNELFIYFTRVW